MFVFFLFFSDIFFFFVFRLFLFFFFCLVYLYFFFFSFSFLFFFFFFSVYDFLANEPLKEFGFGDVRGQFRDRRDPLDSRRSPTTFFSLIRLYPLVISCWKDSSFLMTYSHSIYGIRLLPLVRGRPAEHRRVFASAVSSLLAFLFFFFIFFFQVSSIVGILVALLWVRCSASVPGRYMKYGVLLELISFSLAVRFFSLSSYFFYLFFFYLFFFFSLFLSFFIFFFFSIIFYLIYFFFFFMYFFFFLFLFLFLYFFLYIYNFLFSFFLYFFYSYLVLYFYLYILYLLFISFYSYLYLYTTFFHLIRDVLPPGGPGRLRLKCPLCFLENAIIPPAPSVCGRRPQGDRCN